MTRRIIGPTYGYLCNVCMALAIVMTVQLLASVPSLPPVSAALAGLDLMGWSSQFPIAVPSQVRIPSTVKLAPGTFLVASQRLGDPNFAQTVVLLVDYDQRGARGLIINRPTTVRLATVWPKIEALQQRPDTVYIGGPVARNQMLFLVRSSRQLEEGRRVWEDIYVSASQRVLKRLTDKATAGERFRAYAGYAGWAPRQLEREVSRGDWHIVPADAEIIFDTAPSEIWPELLRRSSLQWL